MYGPSLVIENSKLRIILDRRGDRQDLLEESYDDCKGSDQLMADVCEHLVANGQIEWVQPDEIGALTDAPIIRCLVDDKIYWFPEYQVINPIDHLIIDGEVIFTEAP